MSYHLLITVVRCVLIHQASNLRIFFVRSFLLLLCVFITIHGIWQASFHIREVGRECVHVFSGSCKGPYPASCVVPESALSALPGIVLGMCHFSQPPQTY